MALTQDTLCYRLQSMNSDFGARPSSALARGVQITEFKDARVNPEPVVLEDSDVLLEQYLSPGKLKLLTGVQNLEMVNSLELKVNTSDTSLGNFGSLLPNLTQLRLSNSVIPCVRDLGSSLRSVQVVWMSRCSLVELDGVSSMSSLKELYLSYNEISDISPLSMLDKLQILDLEGNNIEEISQVQYLSFCHNLTSLTLEGNPVCVQPAPDQLDESYDYRQEVRRMVPHLQQLDEEPLSQDSLPNKANVFDADWAFLQELQKDLGLAGSMESLGNSDGGVPSDSSRPGSAALRPSTGYRPGSALRPSSGFRPLTASQRPATTSGSLRPATARPGTASQSHIEDAPSEDAASDLTLGKVICGNPSKALLSRRRFTGPENKEATAPKMFPQFKHKPEHSYDLPPDDDRDREEIMSELRVWKKEHEKRMEKIKQARAPQVLVIDHDDAISLSDDEHDEVTSEEDSDDDLGISPLTFDPTRQNQPGNRQSVLRNSFQEDMDKLLDQDTEHQQVESKGARPKSGGPLPPYPPIKPNSRRSHSPIRGKPKTDNPTFTQPYTNSSVQETAMERHIPMVPPSGAPGSVRRRIDKGNIQNEVVHPVIRGVPSDRPIPSSRPFTAHAVLQHPSQQQKIRRQLPSVPSLPSRPSVPK